MRNTLFLLVAATCVALLSGCGNGTLTDAQRSAIGTLGKQLPAPYRDGLVVDSVHRNGSELVFVIRFPEASVDMAKAKPELFEALRRDEDEAITELCAERALAPVYAAGGSVHRRFVDAKGATFFEVELKPSHCLPH